VGRGGAAELTPALALRGDILRMFGVEFGVVSEIKGGDWDKVEGGECFGGGKDAEEASEDEREEEGRRIGDVDGDTDGEIHEEVGEDENGEEKQDTFGEERVEEEQDSREKGEGEEREGGPVPFG